MSADIQTRLERTAFGSALSPHSRQRLAALCELIVAKPGQLLFREGVRHDAAYLLLRGRVDLAMTAPGRGALRILTLGPGDIVAWSAVLGDGRMTCSAQALEDSELLTLPGPALKQLMEADRELGFEFMKVLATALSKRLVATRLQLLDIFSVSAPASANAR